MTAPAEADTAPVLALDEILHLPAARPLAESIASIRGGDLTISAANVRNLGAQCAQILVAAVNAWRADGHVLKIIDMTPGFTEGAQLLGLGSFFSGVETAQ
jgi:chemotaxis protein CheX